MENSNSRRDFIKKSVLTTGFIATGTSGVLAKPSQIFPGTDKLPREVWITTLSQAGIVGSTPAETIGSALSALEVGMVYKPDIVCLPETFTLNPSGKSLTLDEKLGVSAMTLERFSAFALQYGCYTICPVYLQSGNFIHNSAVLLGRDGKILGRYDKIHLTEGEIDSGLSPGPSNPQVFACDFGRVGMQICFDALWDDGWTRLEEQGAEIVFWSSAYGGGEVLNGKAWMHKYMVVTSTGPGPSKICDFTGETVARTGKWEKNVVCAPVNLEKAFLHTWPFVKRFDEIRKKYGRKVKITTFHDEEWSVIESLSPEIYVADILKEFELRTFVQHKADAEAAEKVARERSGIY